MSEEELVFLIAVTVVMPVLALWIILNYQKARLKIKRDQADKSLTTSELNSLIDESVASATVPLNDRMAELEEQLHLIGPALQMNQEFDGEDLSEDAPVKTLGKTRA